MVRTKFICKIVKKSIDGSEIVLEPVYSETGENAKFFKYTPYGEIRIGSINKLAAENFIPGEEYYIDFSLVS